MRPTEQPRARLLRIDVRPTPANDYATEELDILVSALKHEGLYRKSLLYRGFDGRNTKRLLATGQDKPINGLNCSTEQEMRNPDLKELADIFMYTEHDHPAIAIFDPRKFTRVDGTYIYRFKEPEKKLEALIAVCELDYSKCR